MRREPESGDSPRLLSFPSLLAYHACILICWFAVDSAPEAHRTFCCYKHSDYLITGYFCS